MSRMKKAYNFSGNTLLITNHCDYFGFSVFTGGSDQPFQAYDGVSVAGTVIENFLCDGNKVMDGHEHSNPVDCVDGLYIQCAVSGTIWAWKDPQQP